MLNANCTPNSLMIICMFGYWITLTYSIENTFIQNICHYIGVMMSTVGPYTAFTMQQNHSRLSMAIIFAAIINAVIYFVFEYKK